MNRNLVIKFLCILFAVLISAFIFNQDKFVPFKFIDFIHNGKSVLLPIKTKDNMGVHLINGRISTNPLFVKSIAIKVKDCALQISLNNQTRFFGSMGYEPLCYNSRHIPLIYFDYLVRQENVFEAQIANFSDEVILDIIPVYHAWYVYYRSFLIILNALIIIIVFIDLRRLLRKN